MLKQLLRLTIPAALLLSGSTLRADIITLKSGETVEGKILEETRTEVKIETKVSNIKTTKTYRRAQIQDIEYKPLPEDFWESGRKPKENNPSDGDPSGEEPDVTDPEETEPDEESEATRAGRGKLAPEDQFIIVPVEGGIGETVTSHGLRNALLQAKNRRIGNVVFMVDSPGGYVYEAVQILEVLKEFDADLEYHCFIQEGAISAASVFAAASDRIFVRPDARLGGAVAYSSSNSTGAAEVDAKFNSIWAAEIAARAESKGHSGDAFRAMVEIDAQLYLTSDGKFSPSQTAGSTELDSRSTILTIRAAQMVQAGMATQHEGDAAGLGTLLGRPSWTEIRNIGTRAMSSAAKERAELQKTFEEALAAFSPALDEFKRSDPRQFNYQIIREEGGVYRFDSKSMRDWVTRSDAAIRACNTMLKSLGDIASVNKKAEKTKALHLLTIPNGMGHEAYVEIDRARDWLSEHRNNPPAREMAYKILKSNP
jgi:hypothetical protein